MVVGEGGAADRDVGRERILLAVADEHQRAAKTAGAAVAETLVVI